MATLEIDKMNYATDGAAQAAYVSDAPANLEVYSEDTIKTQGDYSLKVVADTSSVGKKLTHTLSPVSDLSGVNNLKFDIRSNVTGDNIKLSLYANGAYDTKNNLVLHYKMNDDDTNTTVIDNSNSGNDGVSSDTTDNLTYTGLINGALDLSADYITPTTPIVFGDNGTVNFWVNNYAVEMMLAGGAGNGGTDRYLYWFSGDGNIYLGSNTFPEQVSWSSSGIDFTGWHMFTLVKVGLSVTLYIDTVDRGTRSLSTLSDIYEIGRGIVVGSTYGYASQMDDTRVYNRALSEADIDVLYNSGDGTEDAVVEEILVTDITPNIVVADQFQTVNWNISAVANNDKDTINTLKVEIVDDTSANTTYIDNVEIAQAIDVIGLI
jgi:hypothetical protein